MGAASGLVLFLVLGGVAFLYIELTRKPDEKSDPKK
jgi:hypothetical protein